MAAASKPGSGPSTLQTVDRALRFLEIVATSEAPLTIRDVANELGVNITTCYHLFNTLLARGYVDRDPDQTLRVGFRAAVLYDGYQRGFALHERMNDFVTQLARRSTETAWVSSLVDDSVVLTAFADGPQSVRATGLYVGLSGREHERSSGRAVLAYLTQGQRERVLAKALSGIDADAAAGVRAKLEVELPLIRERGWALDDQVYNTEIVGVAAPYFSAGGSGRVLGAIGLWAPAQRGHETLDALVEHVLQASREATELFGRQR